jgi:predicted TIM-barrel fold metal-dependent hydrolase
MAARDAGRASTDHNRTLMTTIYRTRFAELEVRLRAMDAMRIDVQAVSPAPLYHYWAGRDLASRIVASANEGIAALCARRPDRLVGLAMLSMQHPELASSNSSTRCVA